MACKNIILLVCVFFMPVYISAGYDEPETNFPMGLKYHWTYSLYSKKENKQKDDVHTYISKTEKHGNVLYYVYEVPSRGMRYHIKKQDDGVYVKAAKVNLPILGFIGVDIVFNPSVCVVKFPFSKGGAWKYDGTVHVQLLFIGIDKKIQAEFTQMGYEAVDVNGKTMTAYHMHGLVSRGWEVEKPLYGDYWLVPNTGVVKAETKNSRMELKSYILEQEPAQNASTIIQK